MEVSGVNGSPFMSNRVESGHVAKALPEKNTMASSQVQKDWDTRRKQIGWSGDVGIVNRFEERKVRRETSELTGPVV